MEVRLVGTYVVAPVDSRVIRAADAGALPRPGGKSGDATEAVKIIDTLENGINLGSSELVAELNLAPGKRHGPRILHNGRGSVPAGNPGKLKSWVDADGLGYHLLHSAVECLDLARRDLDLPREGDNFVAGDADRGGSVGDPG